MRDETLPRLPDAPDRRKLLSVQVLRAAAALSVVVHHAGYDADTVARLVGRVPIGLDRLFDWTFGIHLFFVISGFIMVRTARDFGTPGAPVRFLIRRVLRIVPLYWLLTTLVIIGSALAPSLLNSPVEGAALRIGSYLFVPVMRIDGEIRPVLGQGWTLNYEMIFYVVFAGAMVLRRCQGLILLAATLIGLVTAGRLAAPSAPVLVVWTDGLLMEFLLGIGVGLASEAGWRLRALPASMLAFVGLATATLLGPGWGSELDPWIAKGLPAAAILAACVIGPVWKPTPAVLALAVLGDASYSLYLTHPFAVRFFRVAWTGTLGGRWPIEVFVILAVGSAIALALAVFRLIEAPMTASLHRRFPMVEPHRKPRAAAP